MNESEAIAKIEASIAQGAQVISPKRQEQESYLKNSIESLFSDVIKPVRAVVVAATYPEYDLESYKNSKVWAIARSGSHWLLTLETENEFALGFGNSADEITMLGFSSSDALGEWLG